MPEVCEALPEMSAQVQSLCVCGHGLMKWGKHCQWGLQQCKVCSGAGSAAGQNLSSQVATVGPN